MKKLATIRQGPLRVLYLRVCRYGSGWVGPKIHALPAFNALSIIQSFVSKRKHPVLFEINRATKELLRDKYE